MAFSTFAASVAYDAAREVDAATAAEAAAAFTKFVVCRESNPRICEGRQVC